MNTHPGYECGQFVAGFTPGTVHEGCAQQAKYDCHLENEYVLGLREAT